MAVQFSCTVCGKRLRAGDGTAGRRLRCPGCGKVATIPDAEPAPLPSVAGQGVGKAETDRDIHAPAVSRQPNWTVRVLVGILSVTVIGVGVVGYYGYSSSQKKKEERGRLTRLVGEQVRIAAQKGEQHEFGRAKGLLAAAETEVEESRYATASLIDELKRQLVDASFTLDRREADYLAEKKRLEEEESKRKAKERLLTQARARREAEKARVAAEAKAREEAVAEQRRREEAESARRAAEETRLAKKAKARQKAAAAGNLSPVTLKVADGELLVRFQFTTLYIPGNRHETRLGYARFFFVSYQASGGTVQKKPVEGYFRVNGKAEKLTVRSSNRKILGATRDFRPGKRQMSRDLIYTDDAGLSLTAVGPGVASVTVTLAGQSVSIPMKVVQLPINGGGFRDAARADEAAHTKEEVIKILGLPDQRIEDYLSWPDSASVDGIYYSASDPRYGVHIEHWKYNKYPGAVIAFNMSKVNAVRTVQRFEAP